MEQQKKSELQTSPSHLNCVDETENLHIQADSGQSRAEERNFPQGSLQPVVATVEQLTDEEKTIYQETKESTDGDTIQEKDSKRAAEEGSTQDNVLKQKKNKTEKTPADSLRVPTVKQFTKFKGKSAAAVGPMPDNSNAEQALVSDIKTGSHVSSYDTTNQEDLETLTEAATGEKLPAEELNKLPQVNNQEETDFGGEASMVKLTDEEKNTCQVRWETYSGDSSEDEDSTPAPAKMPIQENNVQYMKIDEDKLQRALDLLGLGGSFIIPDVDGLISKGKKPLAHYGCANMNGPIYYKGNSSPARTITLDPDEGNTDAEQAWAKQSNSTSTKVTKSDDITRSHATPPDQTHEHMYKDAIFRIGAQDANENDIILINAGKLPRKENFNNKKDFDNEARQLISYINIYINAYVDTHHFVFVVHPGDDTKCRTKSSQMGKKIYKLLKENFSDRLVKCIIYKPQFKLRAALHLQRPFMKREMRQKIVMTKSRLSLENKYGIPETVIRCL